MTVSLGPPQGRDAPAGPAPYLVIDQVSRSIGSFRALDRASLVVAPGEFVSCLGPSGCGKTVLLRAIAGIDPPTSGRIVQDGRDITALPAAARDIGLMAQTAALRPRLDVAGQIAHGLRGRAWPKPRRDQRVAELLALIGMEDFRDKYPEQLSGGQQQRVALARALAPEPGLLLLDEPLSALDATTRLELRQEIQALQRRLGITTLLVTHDQEQALALSDRIIVMSHGHIVQTGTPESVYRQPASAYVARMIGRGSLFDAVVEAPPGFLLADGLRLPCVAAHPLLFGTPVQAFIRPEEVRVGALATALPGHFTAEVTHMEFLGPVRRLFLRAGALRLEADVDPTLRPAIGQPLPVALPAERLMAFPLED